MQTINVSDKLQEEIDRQRQDIRSESYSMSIGELVSLYENEEIEIHPEFQRFFRWSDFQKTSLIESILLGIPIPPIFVSQRDSGEWDVVDGLQRLSTIYQFLGKLRNERGELVPPLVLQGTKYLPSLENKKWEDSFDKTNALTKMQQLLIKRYKISVVIFLKESSPNIQYELFQRLNKVTPQEVRNYIIGTNPAMYSWMQDLSNNKDFKACTNLSKKLEGEQYQMELMAELLVLRKLNIESEAILNITEFITDKLQEIAKNQSFNYEEEKRAFETIFKVLNQTTKEDTFRKYDPIADKFSGDFLLDAFEVIAIGIGYHYQKYEQLLNNEGISQLDIKGRLKTLWENEEYKSAYGRGKDAKTRIPRLVPLGRQLFDI
ncbi:MAG: DUF262 domain-containing protein [Coleofasciculaceae cyanobacterium SM2_1_6]|nr:DUF262 domain-containing protein [Coleofasciculaceae cyanobacterium SM2_1_6]